MKISLPLLAVLSLGVVFVCAAGTGGAFIYPVDDAYIHMALARSIAERGVYAVSGDLFAPASSSILWPYLLAAFRFFSTSDYVPLALNLVCLLASLFLLERELPEGPPNARPRLAAAAPLFACLLTPMIPLALVGMEHSLHVVTTLLLLRAATKGEFSKQGDRTVPRAPGNRELWSLGALSALAVSVRYESLFIALPLALALGVRRSFAKALVLASFGLAPAVVFGVWLHARAGIWLPASILLKRDHFPLTEIVPVLVQKWSSNVHLVALLAILAVALLFAQWQIARAKSEPSNQPRTCERARFELSLAAVVLILHVSLAKTGWLYRYEAYVIALALRALLIALTELSPLVPKRDRLLGAFLLALLFAPLTFRACVSFRTVVVASSNIFEQQVQTARFLATLKPQTPVLLNDVGAPSYFSKARVVDLMGLADLEIARARGFRIDVGLTSEQLEGLSKRAELAIVYDTWFQGVIPPTWVRLAAWTIANNRVCANERVTFYAVDPAKAPQYLAAILAFEPSLPPGVWKSR